MQCTVFSKKAIGLHFTRTNWNLIVKQHELDKHNMFFTSDYLTFVIANLLLNTFFIADCTENFNIILICNN